MHVVDRDEPSPMIPEQLTGSPGTSPIQVNKRPLGIG
jgi:hypothetical protein